MSTTQQPITQEFPDYVRKPSNEKSTWTDRWLPTSRDKELRVSLVLLFTFVFIFFAILILIIVSRVFFKRKCRDAFCTVVDTIQTKINSKVK